MAKLCKKPAAAKAQGALRELWPGQSVELLKALHILTRDGALNADSRRKLKQVLHLANLIRPALDAAFAVRDQPVLADLGAGKSYLGFVLYDLFFRGQGRGVVIGVEARPDLIETSKAIAAASGFERMRFVESAIRDAALPEGRADIVTALHACDTASDEAILFALRHDAKFVALVPCCQAELASELEGSKKPQRQLWRHPIQRREFGAHLTNVLRGLFLEAHGYKVRVTELTGLEHTLKNEFIFAERHQRANARAKAEYDRLVEQFGVQPKLLAAA
ncbi:MAG: SAM-dependent methyltransferase [Alphaproteobacteria bacterium]|nr:SAM-dependent methyltransferase [Alphaproteobacteria bacterium]MBV9694754.1 SAM-dependent methyltransferase [Alphaproteobacteria bacterium]